MRIMFQESLQSEHVEENIHLAILPSEPVLSESNKNWLSFRRIGWVFYLSPSSPHSRDNCRFYNMNR